MIQGRSAEDKVELTKADNGEPIEDEIKNLRPGTIINVRLQSEPIARYDLTTSDEDETAQEGPEGPLEGTSQIAGPGEVLEALQQAKSIRTATQMWKQANTGEASRAAPDPFLQVTTNDPRELEKRGCIPVLGSYVLYPTENKRPCYTKTDGDQMTMYYWQGCAEEKDEDMTGWWIGQEPGGDRVHARSISDAMEPPTDEWSAPWDKPPQKGLIRIMKHKIKPYDKEKDDKARKRVREKEKNQENEPNQQDATPAEGAGSHQQASVEAQKEQLQRMLQERDIRSNITKITTNQCCEKVYHIINQFDNIPEEQREEPTKGKGRRKEAATAIATAVWEEAEKLRDQQPEQEAQNKRPKSEDTRAPKEEESGVQGKPTKARSSSLK